mmetsp:Transcript_14157/g.40603  ORF Transcript_14157/g.40603 Transcript_14157/m.40603 type:complete len:213 (-) Transcript_14157:1267-1905(-)
MPLADNARPEALFILEIVKDAVLPWCKALVFTIQVNTAAGAVSLGLIEGQSPIDHGGPVSNLHGESAILPSLSIIVTLNKPRRWRAGNPRNIFDIKIRPGLLERLLVVLVGGNDDVPLLIFGNNVPRALRRFRRVQHLADALPLTDRVIPQTVVPSNDTSGGGIDNVPGVGTKVGVDKRIELDLPKEAQALRVGPIAIGQAEFLRQITDLRL